MEIQVKILDPRAAEFIPKQGTPFSAGFDIVACVDKPLIVRYGDPAVLVPTGLKLYMGEGVSVAALIVPRSGLGHKHGLVLGNYVGVIDEDYQAEWFVSALNRGNQRDADGNYVDITILPGQKIAQVLFVPVLRPTFTVVEGEWKTSGRGLGGFGSTDKS